MLDGVHFDLLPIPGGDVHVDVDVFELDPTLFVERIGLMKFLAHFLGGKRRERAQNGCERNQGQYFAEANRFHLGLMCLRFVN